MRTITVDKCCTDEEAERLFPSKLLNDTHYDILITDDCDVIRADTGKPLLKFRKAIIPAQYAKKAWEGLRKAAVVNDNRGMASGWDELAVQYVVKLQGARGYVRVSENRFKLIKRDGTLSNTTRAVPRRSGIVGYFDADGRFPYCRQTAFNEKHLEQFLHALPFIRKVDELYRELMPDEYALQRAAADATSPDFVISGTAFTTVTVNKNFQTAVHKDAGDFKEGFGNLTVMQAGQYTGGYTVYPQFRVAVDVRTCDLMLSDVHEWHGNTPIVGKNNFERISLVMYYRENMAKCSSAAEELAKAKAKPLLK